MRLGVEAALVRGELVPGDVEVDDGVVVDVGLAGGARGRVAVPGFVDLQVNGFGGVDFLAAVDRRLPSGGRGAAAHGRDRVPADVHHGVGEHDRSTRSARCR